MVLAATKVFDSAMSPQIKLTNEYQDLEGIPDSTVYDKRLKDSVKANNL